MVFEKGHGGPALLAKDQRAAKKNDYNTGEMVTKNKLKWMLARDLSKTNRGDKVEDLKKEAAAKGIPLTYTEEKVEEGWLNSPKGNFQVAYERGFVDVAKANEYRASIPKSWTMDGKVKADCTQKVKDFVLPEILKQCKDFQTEISAMEHLANQHCLPDLDVTLIFSPKYHCELAGLGIELAWGYSKRFYRRYLTLEEKKKDFLGCVDKALKSVIKDHAHKFCYRTRQYIAAYHQFGKKEATYNEIEKFVKTSKGHRSALDQETGYTDGLLELHSSNQEEA